MLNHQQYLDAIMLPDADDRNMALEQFANESVVLKGVSPAQIIAIMQMACAIYTGTEPMFNSMCAAISIL